MTAAKPRQGEPIRTVEVRGQVRYRAVVDVARPGEPRKQRTATFDTIKAARTWVNTTRSQVATGSYFAPTAETVDQVLDRWLAGLVDVRPATVEHYGFLVQPVRRRLGRRPIASITATDVEALTAWLSAEGGKRGRPLGVKAVRASTGCLAAALDVAVRHGDLPRNVARLARKPRQRRPRGTDLQHWSTEQLRTFVAYIDADAWAACWRLSCVGLRRSEVLGLTWADVDLERGTVSVNRSRVPVSGGHVEGDPKSAASRRTVPVEAIFSGTVAMLRALKARQAADRLAAGEAWVTGPDYVLTDAVGQPVGSQRYSARFRALATAAGLPVIRLHSLRHSIAFLLHDAGVVPNDAASLLGHSLQVHMSTYLPSSGSAGITVAAQAMGRALSA